MAKQKIKDTCHICGNFGELSFEHVPPKGAFNDKKIIVASLEDTLNWVPGELPKGRQQQKGMGAYTLCPKCNNDTGSWYSSFFIDWCSQGMEIIRKANGLPTLFYLNYIFPLPILKQIVTMFFSVNGDKFHTIHPELVKFLLNKEIKYLPGQYRFFVYFNSSSIIRSAGVVGGGDIMAGKMKIFSEITFPPFGYVMTFGDAPPDERMFEITFFSTFEYKEFKVFSLRIPFLPVSTSIPGQYMTEDEIKKSYKEYKQNLENR